MTKRTKNKNRKGEKARRSGRASASLPVQPIAASPYAASDLVERLNKSAAPEFPFPPARAISTVSMPIAFTTSKKNKIEPKADTGTAAPEDVQKASPRSASLTSRLAELNGQDAVQNITPVESSAPQAPAAEPKAADIAPPRAAQPPPQDVEAPLQEPAKATADERQKARPSPGPSSGPEVSPSNETADGQSDVKPLIRRTSNREQREIMLQGMATAKRHLVTVAIFSLAVNLLVLVLPVYLFQVSDRVLTSRSTDTLVMLSVVVIGAIALQSLLDVFRRLLLMRVAVQVETSLGAAVLAAATKGAQQGSTRDFQALLDLQQLRNFITGPTLLQVFDAPIAPVYFLAVFLVHPHLGMILVVASLVLIAIALINRRITAVPFAQASGFTARAGQHVEAMARNAQVINAMGMIREGTILWGRETAQSLKSQISAQDRNVYMTGITKFARLATQVAMLGWGAHLVLANELTGGMMIAASIIASRALSPVEGLIEGWRSVVQARTGYARVTALLNATPLNQERLQLPRPQGRLHVDRVLFVPPPTKRVILNGIDFTLDPGESLAIVGPSGTGKSTLARMLIGSLTPTSGSIRLDLMDIRNWDPRQFGETIGYLAQDVELLPATVKANIARLREDVSDEEVYNAAVLAGVHEMIAQLPQGYETMIGLDGSPLSGGQKQRIGLARAFFGRPRLVVLDEPNSNLDTAGEAALARALLQAKQHGITVVAVTQRPALLKSVDKIMLLHEGKVQTIGPRDEVLQRLAGQKRGLVESAA